MEIFVVFDSDNQVLVTFLSICEADDWLLHEHGWHWEQVESHVYKPQKHSNLGFIMLRGEIINN